jgi:DNA-binding ferritin-like protein
MNEPITPTDDEATKNLHRELISLINQLLVDAIDLHLQAKQTRWRLANPVTETFRPICDQIAEEIDEEIHTLIRMAEPLAADLPALGAVRDLPSKLAKYPFPILTTEDHLKALVYTLRTFMHAVLDAAVSARKLEDRKTANAFAHIARVPSRLGKALAAQIAWTEFDEKALSTWIGEGGTYDHDGQPITLFD